MPRNTSTASWRTASQLPSLSSADVTAVVAAAGSGERLGAGGPKAFVPLAGRPMVEWSIEALRATASVRSIVVARPPGHGGNFGDGVVAVDGGATRSQSVTNALAAVDTDLVAIHDAARPLLTPELLEGIVALLATDPGAGGAIAATPVTDTVKRASPVSDDALSSPGMNNASLVVGATLDRTALWAAQTPQVFRTRDLREALAGPADVRDAATDEAMLVEAAGGRVLIYPSSPDNLKVTTPLDLRLAELLLTD